jgi:hypothetical protein
MRGTVGNRGGGFPSAIVARFVAKTGGAVTLCIRSKGEWVMGHKSKRVNGRVMVYAAAVLAASSLVAGVARADSYGVTADFIGPITGAQTVNLSSNYNDSITGTGSLAYQDVYASIYTFQITGGIDYSSNALLSASATETDTGIDSSTFQAVCIDLTHNINSFPAAGSSGTWADDPLTDVTADGSSGPPAISGNGVGVSQQQANAIEYLFDEFNPSLSTTPAAAAIFQMAIWDVLYGSVPTGDPNAGKSYAVLSSPSVLDGNPTPSLGFSGNSNINAAAADAYTAFVDGSGDSQDNALIFDALPTDLQSFAIAFVPPSSVAAVPLPLSAGVGFGMLAGFGGLAALRKRIRSSKRIV